MKQEQTSVVIDPSSGMTIVGDLVVNSMSIEMFTPSELAIMDIIPKIIDTHPDLYLKYVNLIPTKKIL